MKLLKYAGFVPYLAIAFINASVDLAHKITIQNVLLKSFSGESLVVLTALINAMILLPFILRKRRIRTCGIIFFWEMPWCFWLQDICSAGTKLCIPLFFSMLPRR